MKKPGFLVLWFCFPLFPSYLYFRSTGSQADVYGLSILLGVYSFTLLAGQMYLITRPFWLQKILSVKGIIALHSFVPMIVLVLSLIHRFLKEASGFSMETKQAFIGLFSWFFLLMIIIIAVLLLANTFISKNKVIKKIRESMYSAFRLTYAKVRTAHNLTVLLTVVLCVHVLFSSLSDISFNPAGFLVLCVWTLFCFGSYFLYRVRGRK